MNDREVSYRLINNGTDMIKKSLISGAGDVQLQNNPTYFESIWCEISFTKVKVLIGCICRQLSLRKYNILVLYDLVNTVNCLNDSQNLTCDNFRYISSDWVNDIDVDALHHDFSGL